MKLDDVTGKKVKQIKPRAGVYPFFRDGGEIYVFMMVPSNPKFGGALPQMGKGGIDDGETAEAAAMREGHEELGLLASNVKKIHQIATAKIVGKREGYDITVFAAEVFDKDNFEPHGYEAKWSGWVELDEAIKVSRKNQQQFLKKLKTQFGNQSIEEDREWVQDEGYDFVNPLPLIQNDDAFDLMSEVDGELLQMYKDEQGIDELPDYRQAGAITVKKRDMEGTVEDVPISQIVSIEKYLNKDHIDALRNNADVKSSSDLPTFYKQGKIYYAGDGNHRLVAKYLDGDKTIKALVLDSDKILNGRLEEMDADSISADDADARRKESREPAEIGMHTIYRAVPVDVTTFREMDYVTKSRKFAAEHSESMYWTEEEPYHVIRAMVSNRHAEIVLYNASNPGEYFYDGPEIAGRVIYKAKEYEEYQ